MVSQKTTISLDSSSLTQLAVDMHQHRTNANTAMKNTAHRDKVRNERGGWGESHVDEMIARANEEEVDEVGWMSKDLKKDMRLLEHRKQVNSSGRHMHLQEMHDRAAAYTERHNATQQLASHSQPPTMPRLGERRRNALSVSISTEGSATEGQLSSAHTVALAPRSQVVRPPKHFVGGTPRLAERRKLDGSFSRSIFPTTACEDGHTARVLGPVSAPRTPNTAQLGTAQTPRLVVPTPRTPRPVVPTPRQQHLPMSPSSAHDGREAAQPISSQQPATMVRTATVENIEVQLQRPSKNPVSKNLPPRKRTLKPIMPPQDLRRQSIAQPLQPSARLVVNL